MDSDTNRFSNKQVDALETEMMAPPKEAPAQLIDPNELSDQAQERAKKVPVMQRIINLFKGGSEDYSEIIINSEPLETRVALLVNGVMEKFEIERQGDNHMVGAIFKGRIQNLEPGLKAAFVDIGQPKNAFLHYWDILPAAADAGVEIVRENETASQKARRADLTVKDIPGLYPVGTEILVQISKGQIGTKGPRVTTNIAIPGRYLVLMPYSGQCGISRKIEDRKERERLKEILRKLTIPEGMGLIIRTAGEGKKIRYFVRDLYMLLHTWAQIEDGMADGRKPACLYQEPSLIERTIRDFLTEDVDRIMIDNEPDFEYMKERIAEISPRSKSKLHLFRDAIPIFERFNIERQIEQTYQRKVSLPSGGEIVIEETEALTAIDVNTGSHRAAQKDGKDFILQCNLEAAKESARQIGLRNIGGVIIIDFIDMKQKRDRDLLLRNMEKYMARDKAKTHILPISALGLMQMTRQRHQESNSSGLYVPCPYCNERGIVKSPRTMSIEIQRKLVSILRRAQARGVKEPMQLRVLLNPNNLERLRREDEELLITLEQKYPVKLSFRADPAYHVENFKIIDVATGEDAR